MNCKKKRTRRYNRTLVPVFWKWYNQIIKYDSIEIAK